ncbi:uncharacterized protein LOC144546734 isoform X2 [Carex rostrata]
MASEQGIAALFSMYNDDDDEEENEDSLDQSNPPPSNRNSSPRSPLLPDEPPSDHKTLNSPLPPNPSQIPSPLSAQSSPPLSPVPTFADRLRARKGALGIVDYGHDEMAVSPEHDEGERTLPGTDHMFREDMQKISSPVADNLEKSKSDVSMAVDTTGSDHEMPQIEQTGTSSAEAQNDDLLSRFFGPPVTTKCSEKIQNRIIKFLVLKSAGRCFNEEVRNKMDYRNPDFLQHAVRYQDIDQIGTCFSKEVFDPHGLDKSDFYDAIEADMRREQERKEQERKKSPKVDFVSGGIQPPAVPSTLKTTSSALPPAPSTGDATNRETRNKKSKWDKVEGDVKSSALTTGAAAVLSQSTVGGGYSGFAQQKRREAEEKKTNDKKSDKRS